MPAPAKTRRVLGFHIATHDQYGTREITAEVVYKATARETNDPDEIGNSFNPRFSRYGNAAAAYEGFQVRTYVDNGRCYGVRHVFRPFEVETDRAEAITRVLRRVDKAMKAFQEDEGRLVDDDFTGYLLRVARAIEADYFDWRPFPRAAFERTDAHGIGSAITDMIRTTERVA
jgi:hypothetical protein